MVNGERDKVGKLSQAAIGRALRLSPPAVTKLKKQGMPVDSVEAAQAWRVARQNVAQRKAAPPGLQAAPAPAPESHDAARTRREVAEANLAELREGEARGELIRLTSIKRALSVVVSSTRDALLQIADRLAPSLSAESDVSKVRELLYGEIHAALVELSGAGARLGPHPTGPVAAGAGPFASPASAGALDRGHPKAGA